MEGNLYYYFKNCCSRKYVYISRSGITWSNIICIYNFDASCKTVLCRSCNNSPSHQQYMTAAVSLQSNQQSASTLDFY